MRGFSDEELLAAYERTSGEDGDRAADDLSKLIGAVPTASALYLLSTHFHVEFAAVTTILTWAAKQTKAITGGVEEDEEK